MVKEKSNYETIPYVSVIVCAFNREKTISQTIESILDQKCNFNVEILIGEDCSKDLTRDICMKYRNKYPDIIRLILHKQNCGLGKNWAILVKNAKGKYIASCDDDDFWHNIDKLQLQVDYLDKHLNCGVLHTDIDLLYIKRNKTKKNYYKTNHIQPPEGSIMKEVINSKENICVSTSMIRKDLIMKHIPLDDFIENKYFIQDWPAWVYLAKHCDFNYMPISTTTYRLGYESVSNPLTYEKIEKRYIVEQLMYKKICKEFPEEFIYFEPGHLGYYKGLLLNLAFKKNDFLSARKYANELNELGIKSSKTNYAKNEYSFYAYSFLKKIRAKLRDNSR